MVCRFLWIFLLLIVLIKGDLMATDRRPEALIAIPAQTGEVASNDLGIIQRVVDSYRRCANSNRNLGMSMWQMFFNMRHKPLHDLFLKG